MSEVSVLRVYLFKHSKNSFINLLDEEDIAHGSVMQFSSQIHNSGFTEVISAISDAMPWSSIAKVIIKWIEAKSDRGIIITTENNDITHAKGYSIDAIKKILPKSINITVIQTKPDE